MGNGVLGENGVLAMPLVVVDSKKVIVHVLVLNQTLMAKIALVNLTVQCLVTWRVVQVEVNYHY